MKSKMKFDPFNLEKEPTYTIVILSNYDIKHPLFNTDESQLTLELTFMSDDSTPQKFTKFLKELDEFLIEKGYQKGMRD